MLIEWYGYIVVMPLINGPDEELNEILYQISVDFWEQVFNALLNKQKNCKQDLDISPQQAIITLQREIKNLAKTNHLICTIFPHNEHFYLSLLPYPIYIGIENNTGCSSVSAPNIKTIHFNHTQCRNTLLWIQNYIELDITPLEEKKKLVREKIYLNFKNVQIVPNSIFFLCNSFLEKEPMIDWSIHQTSLKSLIHFEKDECGSYDIEIFHKPFSENPSILINQLTNPHEETIEYKIVCRASKPTKVKNAMGLTV